MLLEEIGIIGISIQIMSRPSQNKGGWEGVTVENNRVTGLELNNKSISILHNDIGNLSKLINLSLSYNNISILPSSIGNLTNLYTLDIRDNNLSILPSSISNLINLEVLNLGNNNLSVLPSNFSNLMKLKDLAVYNNNLSSLPVNFGQLTNLTTIHAAGNQLSFLPPSFIELLNLKDLELGYNNLSSLPANFNNLTSLRSLLLNDNNLSTLPINLNDLVNLIGIKVKNNYFQFQDLKQIKDVSTLPIIGEWNSWNYSPQKKYLTQDVQGTLGQSIQLDGTVTGTPSENTYKWYKDGVEIPNSNTAILTIDNTTASDEGIYYCKVTNSIVTGLELISEDIEVTLREASNDCAVLVSDWTLNTATYNSTSGQIENTTGGGWNTGGFSSGSYLEANESGILEIAITDLSSSIYMLGFSSNPTSSYTSINHELYYNNKNLYIHEGSWNRNYGVSELNDKLYIERIVHSDNSSEFIYSRLRNNHLEILHRTTSATSPKLFVAADLANANSKTHPAYLNKCLSDVKVTAQNSDCSNELKVLVDIPASGNYYSYQVLETSLSVQNFTTDQVITGFASAGTYIVRVRNNTTGSTRDFSVIVRPHGVIFDTNLSSSYFSSAEGRLVNSAAGGWNTGGFSSGSYLEANESGILEIAITDLSSSIYMLGFSSNPTSSYTSINHELYYNNKNLYIHEGSWNRNYGVSELNDKLYIERIVHSDNSSEFIYSRLRNNHLEILHRTTSATSPKLFVAADLANANSKTHPAYLNKCNIEDPCTSISLSESSDWAYSSPDVSMNANGQLVSSLDGLYASVLGTSEIYANGKLSFTVDNTDIYYTVGFTSETTLPVTQMGVYEAENFMDYGFYVWKNTLKIYEQGHIYTFDGILQVGTQLSVERRGNKIQYRRDNLLVWESIDEGNSLRSYSAIWADPNQTTTIPVINFSPCATYNNITTVGISTNFCEAAQIINLSSSPSAAYTYEWTSMADQSTGIISGTSFLLPDGLYRITTKLGTTIVDENFINISLANALSWVTNEAIKYDPANNQLISTPNNVYYAWVLSEEEVTFSVPRKLSVTLDDPLRDNYMLGFTAEIPNTLPITMGGNTLTTTMDYGWYVWRDELAIYENGRKYTFPYEEGVKLSIERIGNKILYRKDDLLVYQSDMSDNSNYTNATTTVLHPHAILWRRDDGLGKIPTIDYGCPSALSEVATIEIGSNSCTGTEVSITPLFNSDDYTYEYTYLDQVPNIVGNGSIPIGNPVVFVPPFDGKYNVKVTSTSKGVQEFVIDITTTNWEAPNVINNYPATWALGTESLPADKNGSVSFTIDRCGANLFYQVGLSSTGYSTGDPDLSMKYGWYVWEGVLKIYEFGNVTPIDFDDNDCLVGTSLSVEKINNTIYYYKNGSLIRTTEIANEYINDILYPHYITWNNNKIPPVSFTSCEVTTCDATPLLSISERIGYDYEWYDALDRTTPLGTGTEYTPEPLRNGEHVFSIVGTNPTTGSQYVITQTVTVEALEILNIVGNSFPSAGEEITLEAILGMDRDLVDIINNRGYSFAWTGPAGAILTTNPSNPLEVAVSNVISGTYTLTVSNAECGGSSYEKEIKITSACGSEIPIPVLDIDFSKNYGYRELTDKLAASYYTTTNEGILNFTYKERYKSGKLVCHIYNWDRCEIGLIDLDKSIGRNWYSLNLMGVCTEDEFYLMEVYDENDHRTVLNFQYRYQEMDATLSGEQYYCSNNDITYTVNIENGQVDYVVELWVQSEGALPDDWTLLDVKLSQESQVEFEPGFARMYGNFRLKAIVIDEWGKKVPTNILTVQESGDCPDNLRETPPVTAKTQKINVRFSIRNLLQNVNKVFNVR